MKVLMKREEFHNKNDNRKSFIIDSGASRHMVHTFEILSDVKNGPTHEILAANGELLKGHLYGNLTPYMEKDDSANSNRIKLTDVLVVKGLSDNLVSVDALPEKGVDCNFTKNKVYLIDTTDGNQKLGYGEARSDGLRYLACHSPLKSKAVLSAVSKSVGDWHMRLGHTA
eukprot:Plantae.Rhodophyta-Palmaria_palmata.ctg8757.p1 GENE.Plantae.Rhodophyta-Palmaria_palmata.ctg8757~~Plantae.Rhodophyta-Palmaria_palmata.ctg8757.p1  ORF type:complete len:170 (+),score=24.93 Plantae.Rhodophyta-Palmaria_palmata.ctg8757:423-932(+)